MLDDQREMQRFSIAVPARVEPADEAPANPGPDLYSRDVCAGGAFFLTSQPLDVGTQVVVQMLLCPRDITASPGRKAQVTISGEVLRTDRNGIAVRFNSNYKITSVAA